MPFYVTKSKIKEAEQFFSDGRLPLPFKKETACCFDDGWYVVTTHGQRTAIVDGDFIVREPDGNGFYPCKPDIWLNGHEAVPPAPPSDEGTICVLCDKMIEVGESEKHGYDKCVMVPI